MEFIVIELFPEPESAAIVVNEDGTNKIFTSYEEAKQECDDCQDGLIVEINSKWFNS